MNIKILILLFLVAKISSAQWQWAKSFGGSNGEAISATTSDANGNIYITGSFYSPTITFGLTTLINSSSVGSDIFIAKLDANGNVAWAKSIGGNYTDNSTAITFDLFGNLYITGSFGSDSITIGSTTLHNNGFIDALIIKFNQNGNVIWAKNEGGNLRDVSNSIISDKLGNIYITGYFEDSTVIFGSTILTNTGIYGDIFLAKYDSSGNVLWAKSNSGKNQDQAYSIAIDTLGNVFIAGIFGSDTISFDGNILVNTNMTSMDIFLIKYNSLGSVIWAIREGGIYSDNANAISTDIGGNIYMTGYFRSYSIILGVDTFTNSGPGYEDIFLLKYDSNGNTIWAKHAGGNADDEAYSLSVDSYANIYITGQFVSDSIFFGTTTLINDTIFGGSHIFIAKYDNNGNLLWAQQEGKDNYNYSYSINADISNNIFIAGHFNSANTFFGNDTLINLGATGSDMFIAKLNSITDIQETNTIDRINIYPNPSKGTLTIQSSEKISSIEIMNILGENIYQIRGNSKQEIINLPSLLNGIYFLQLKTREGILNRKIIIQH